MKTQVHKSTSPRIQKILIWILFVLLTIMFLVMHLVCTPLR